MKYIRYFVLLGIIILTVYYRSEIANYILRKTNPTKKNIIITNNSYYNSNNLKFVKTTNDFNAKNKQDILNIFYTILNSGTNDYEFTCDKNYNTCLKDVEIIINDKETLAGINNLVHPYNSYENIDVSISNYGKIDININKVYKEDETQIINNYIIDFINNNINNNMSDYDKVKLFHDYIIDNTSFDIETANNDLREKNKSHTAYGLITNHKAICGGYSDIMSIYLYLLNIPNYRIATNDHVWNLVYINNEWLHLDLTWDDPVTNDGSQILLYDYFLINNNKLFELDQEQHNFNNNIYLETKK